MDQTVPELLHQGLIITVLGMGLVFAALGLLWGIMALMTRLFRPEPEPEEPGATDFAAPPLAAATTEPPAEDPLTAERARVAALVAGALMANVVPLLLDVPIGPAFEHGRTAPIWVTANRARDMRSWQPPRVVETSAGE
jgi:sodium pump decarboxylase gamma subunit